MKPIKEIKPVNSSGTRFNLPNIPIGKLNGIAVFLNFAFFGFVAYLQVSPNDVPSELLKVVIGFYIVLLVIYGTMALLQAQFGLKGIIRRNPEDKYKDITTKIKKAKNEIKIIVYHGESLLKAIKDEIVEAINRKETSVSVKMLMSKSESVLLNEVWALENRDENNRIDKAREYIKEIETRTAENPHRFDCQEYNTQVRYSIIIVDNKWAWWTPYHPGRRVEDTTSIVLTKKGKDSIIMDCIDHFERLWVKLDKERQCEWRKENQKCSKS